MDANGNEVASYSYDAWGNELSSSGTVMLGDGSRTLREANPFRYSSYFFDRTSGLYYLNARYYSPTLGRFLTGDPIRGLMAIALTQNRYLYCFNQPVRWEDPSGRWVIALTVEATAFTVGGGPAIAFQVFLDDQFHLRVAGFAGATVANPVPGASLGARLTVYPAVRDVGKLLGPTKSMGLTVGNGIYAGYEAHNPTGKQQDKFIGVSVGVGIKGALPWDNSGRVGETVQFEARQPEYYVPAYSTIQTVD